MTDRPEINATHDPALTSWVESANDPSTDFPIQNLPLCCFEAEHDGHSHAHHGVRIGDQVLDVSLLNEAGFFRDRSDDEEAPLDRLLELPAWHGFLARPTALSRLRVVLQEFLRRDAGGGQRTKRLREKACRPAAQVAFMRPTYVPNYTDFYASVHHATNVGRMFRPDNPLLPNYKHVPIGYHGRASSIVESGRPVRRPVGQQSPPEGAGTPAFGPSAMLDYELEVGVVIADGNRLGEAIAIGDADAHIAGLCLINDWSARDVQKWEYQPLGPFLAKNFATTMGDCIVTREALAPFRVALESRPEGDPTPLAYLRDERDAAAGGFDVTLEVFLRSAEMAKRGMDPVRLSRSSLRSMYWTFAQMIAHHTVGGCNLISGDVLASGTVSGPTEDSRGCLLELTWRGVGPDGKPLPRRPVELPTGETRTFLADGDTVVMRGWCEREGYRRIGLGECRATIEAARVPA